MAQSTSESIDLVSEELEQQTATSTDTEINTETATELPGETVPETELFQEVVYIQATELDEQLLAQSKVTNNLLGISIALQIFCLGLFFLVFFYKIIKNNVTDLYL